MLRATAAGPLLTYKPHEVTGSIPGADIRESAWVIQEKIVKLALAKLQRPKTSWNTLFPTKYRS